MAESYSLRAVLLTALILSLAGACQCHRDHTDAQGTPGVLTGKVIDQPPPTGQVSIKHWRFQPDGSPGTYLRLTRIHAQEATTPESQEIKLDHWAGKKIKVKYQIVDQTWVWGAEVIKTLDR